MPYRQPLDQACAYALNYLEHVAERAVGPRSGAIEALARLDEPLSAAPIDPAETLALLHEVGSPATMATQGSRFFGLVAGGALPVTVGAQWLAAAWDQLALDEVTSPIAVKLETVAARWVLDLLDLPRESSIGFVTGTTMGHLSCLAAARGELLRRQGYDLKRQGLRGAPRLRIVVSDEIHVSALKVLSILGFGSDEIERVPTDAQGRLRIDALPPIDGSTIICCQAGNVNSGAFDPVGEICDIAGPAGAWVHVDGAFGLWARSTRALDHLTAGIDRADSWTTDTHKWLNTPWDCGLAICRHPQAVRAALSTDAAYIKLGGTVAPKDLVPEFGRRGRGIEVWAALRTLGGQGVRDLVERCCRHAQTFSRGLAELGCEVLNDVVINQVVAKIGTPEQTAAVIAYAQQSGECWFGPTSWHGHAAFRISVSSWRTTDDDVIRSLKAINAAVRDTAHLSQKKEGQ